MCLLFFVVFFVVVVVVTAICSTPQLPTTVLPSVRTRKPVEYVQKYTQSDRRVRTEGSASESGFSEPLKPNHKPKCKTNLEPNANSFDTSSKFFRESYVVSVSP